MSRVLIHCGLRLLACSLVAYLLWRALGPVGLAASAPLFGVALAKPIFELLAEMREAARSLVWSDIAGRHFEHRGHALNVVLDDNHACWLSVDDVRKIIRAFPRGPSLQRQYPQGVHRDPNSNGWHISAEALLSYLAKSTDSDSLRFRNWLQREVVVPATIKQRRLGIQNIQANDE